MTDKQIIIYKKECYNEPHCSLNQVLEQLKAKEQECEELKEALNEGCLHNLTLMTEQRVLLQTLTEIKEIAEKIDDECEYLLFGSCAAEAKKQILQKISECEGIDA